MDFKKVLYAPFLKAWGALNKLFIEFQTYGTRELDPETMTTK